MVAARIITLALATLVLGSPIDNPAANIAGVIADKARPVLNGPLGDVAGMIGGGAGGAPAGAVTSRGIEDTTAITDSLGRGGGRPDSGGLLGPGIPGILGGLVRRGGIDQPFPKSLEDEGARDEVETDIGLPPIGKTRGDVALDASAEAGIKNKGRNVDDSAAPAGPSGGKAGAGLNTPIGDVAGIIGAGAATGSTRSGDAAAAAGLTASVAASRCIDGSVLTCCDLANADDVTLPSLPNFVCNAIDFTVVGGNVPFEDLCGSTPALCCSNVETNGLTNFQCKNVEL